MATYLEIKLERLKALDIAYDAAISAILTNGAESYELVTGQSSQKVTRFNIKQIQQASESNLALITNLEARLGLTPARVAVPRW